MKLGLGLFYFTLGLLCSPSCYSFVIQRTKSNYLPQTDVNPPSVQNSKFNPHDKNEELNLNLTKPKWELSREYQVLNKIENLSSNFGTQRIKRQEAAVPIADYGKADDMEADVAAEDVTVEDVKAEDVTVEDVKVEDVKVEDVKVEDVKVEDVTVEDVTVEDVTVEDVKVEDVTVEDVTVEDVTVEDVKVEDVKVEDVTVEDVAVEDVAVEDVAVEDVAVEDVAVEDVAVEDVAVEDVAAEDVAAEDATAEGATAEDATAEDATAEDVDTDDVEADGVEAEDATAEGATAEDVDTDDVEADGVEAEDATAEGATAEGATAEDATAEDVAAEDATAEGATAEDVTAEDVDTDDVEADGVEAEDVEAEDVEAEDVEAEDVEAEDVEAEDVKADDSEAEVKDDDVKVDDTVTTVDAKADEKTEDLTKSEDTTKTVTEKAKPPIGADETAEDTTSTKTDKVELPVVADDITVDEKEKDTTITETCKVEDKHVEEAEKSSESDSSETKGEKPLEDKNIEKTETFSESDGTEVSPKEIETSLKFHNSEKKLEGDNDNDKTEIISTNNKDDANQKAPIPPTAETPDTKINAESSAGNVSPIKEIDMTKFVPSIEERVKPKQEENPPVPVQIPAPPTIGEVPVREQPKPFNQPNNRPLAHNPPMLQPKNKLKCPLPYVLFEPPQLPFRRQTSGRQNPIMHHVSRISPHFPNLRPMILYSEEGEVTPGGLTRNEHIVCVLPSEDDIHDRSVLSEESKPSNPDFQPNFRRLFKPDGNQPQPSQSEGKLHSTEAPKDHQLFQTYRPHEHNPGNSQFAQNDDKFHERAVGPIFNIPGHRRVLPPHLKSNSRTHSRGSNPRMPPNRHRTEPETFGNTQIMQMTLRNQMPKNATATETGFGVTGNDYKPAIFYYQQPKAAQPVNNTSLPSHKMYKNKARLYSAASKRG